jgi:hypothetical protein
MKLVVLNLNVEDPQEGGPRSTWVLNSQADILGMKIPASNMQACQSGYQGSHFTCLQQAL